MTEDIWGLTQTLLKKYWYWLAMLLIIGVALWYRLGIINSYIIPTYGNTMYHVGIERETILTGFYPRTELSYGGGFPNFYVPAYRLLIASMSVATGIDPMVMSGLMTIVLAIAIILIMYAVAYRLSDNLYIALFAAFFFLVSPEITIFTMRSLPELLGLFMVPFTFYFVIRKNWPVVIIGAIITALTHQMTLLVLVSVIAGYMLLQFIRAAWLYYKNKENREMYMVTLKTALCCLAPIVAACLAYALWLMYSMGTLNIMDIAQVVNHEGNAVDVPLFVRTGVFVLIFAAIGLAYIILQWWDSRPKAKKSTADKPVTKEKSVYGFSLSADSALFIIAWVVTTLLLTFNDKIFYVFPDHKFLIFPNFMDRYFTFFVQIAIIIAAYGMYALLSALDLDVLKVKP